MSSFITRKYGRKGLLCTAGAIVAAGAASVSLAVAQAPPPPPDGGPPPPAAGAPPIVTTCGPMVSNTVVTRNAPSTTTAIGWQALPGTVRNFVIPDGTGSKCLKVLFTAETACSGTAGTDFCYVRALVDGTVMDPDGANFQAIDSEDGSASAHAYEWIKRVPEGAHTVQIQWRVLGAGMQAYADDWTEDIQILQ